MPTLPSIDASGELPVIGPLGAMELGSSPDEVHLWATLTPSLGPDAEPDIEAHPYWRSLSTEEQERTIRFVFGRDRFRFLISHGLLRAVLARYVGEAPQHLRITRSARGKPRLVDHPRLHFNLTHSADATLIAVTRSGEVGVDIEERRHVADASGLVSRFFSPSERQRYAAMSIPERELGFLAAWTRKEAYVKALGSGLAMPLDSFSVNFGLPAQLVDPANSGWTLRHLAIGNAYVGALASSASNLILRGGLLTL